MTTTRVLVADDNLIFRAALCTFIEEFSGLRVAATASDGQEAVQLVQEIQPDLLILDLQMPGMDGLAVLRHLRQMGSHLPVLMLSAHEPAQYRRTVLTLGALDFIHKMDLPRLTAAIQAFGKQNQARGGSSLRS